MLVHRHGLLPVKQQVIVRSAANMQNGMTYIETRTVKSVALKAQTC